MNGALVRAAVLLLYVNLYSARAALCVQCSYRASLLRTACASQGICNRSAVDVAKSKLIALHAWETVVLKSFSSRRPQVFLTPDAG
jgi:hypothetical protein